MVYLNAGNSSPALVNHRLTRCCCSNFFAGFGRVCRQVVVLMHHRAQTPSPTTVLNDAEWIAI